MTVMAPGMDLLKGLRGTGGVPEYGANARSIPLLAYGWKRLHANYNL